MALHSRRSELVKIWKERICKWKSSGKTAYAWCRELGVPYQSFINWRRRLSSLITQPSPDFVELPAEDKSRVGFELHVAGIQLSLDKGFDEESLRRCLQLLRRL